MQIWLTPSTGLLSLSGIAHVPLTQIRAVAGAIFPFEVFSTEPLDSAAGGILSAVAKGDSTGIIAAIAMTWTKKDGPPISYVFALNLNTSEIMDRFAGSLAPVHLQLQIDWTSGAQSGKSQSINLLAERPNWSGSEPLPDPLVIPAPVVLSVSSVPTSETDFFMFPGGVPPIAGTYQISDSAFLYTITAGQTSWGRTPIPGWTE